ncbi:MAG: hypothetical protein ACQXXF_04775, partial [Thermoplasmatota archaeon]
VKNIPITVDVTMEIKNMHFKSLIIFPYWRFHIKTNGFISMDYYEEKVNDTHIMEFFRLA